MGFRNVLLRLLPTYLGNLPHEPIRRIVLGNENLIKPVVRMVQIHAKLPAYVTQPGSVPPW